MDIPFRQRLAFRQARLSVLAALVLGSLLCLLQIALDYASEDALINQEAATLLAIARQPASQQLGEPLRARQLLEGLLQAPPIVRASLLDGSGAILASASRPAGEDGWQQRLSHRLFGSQRSAEIALPENGRPAGLLRLQIDTAAYGSHFLQRAGITLARCLLATLLLSLALFALYYRQLTRPLTALIQALGQRDPQRSSQTPLPCPPEHRHDEIGLLIDTCNRQLACLDAEIAQRRAAEAQLTRSLGELEARVQERTRALEGSNRELQQTQRQATDLAQARTQFLASIGHEIRTPLNGLLGMLALALDGSLSNEQRQQLLIAHDSGKVLVDLLNDILDLSKFEAGQLELESIPFDLGALAEETASLLSQNTAPEVELTCLIDPQLPALLLGDPTRVRQVISNLLSNALKFTRRGRVDLRIALDSGGVRIQVNDTGIGIPEDAQQRIFQPFTQAGAGITRQFGGTGLGLALTRRLCEAMQGELLLSSREGIGSQFSAILPLRGHTPAPRWPQLPGRVVALCVADSGLAELLGSWLPNWGVHYRRVNSLDEVSAESIDLLICAAPDSLLPLRQRLSAPLLLVSPYGTFIASEQIATLAPFEQLPRPLGRTALHQALQRLLAPQREPSVEPASSATPRSHQARVLLVEDNQVNQMVAKGMLTKLGCQVAVAGHGGEAIAYLEQQPVDLVLMDCNMPVMDGYEATRRIRQSGRWPNLPIIALTANALPDERERCQAAGMNDYLAKPFRREDLTALLDSWLPLTSAQ